MHADWAREKAEADGSVVAAENAIEELVQHPGRNRAVRALARDVSGDRVDLIGRALAGIGSDEALLALLDLFKRNKKDRHLAAIMAEAAAEPTRRLLSASDYEDIVVGAFEFSMDDKYASLLGSIASDRAIDKLICMLFQTHRTQDYRDEAIRALVRVGSKVNRELVGRLQSDWVAEQKDQQEQFRRDLLQVLAATGDADCIPPIRVVMQADASTAKVAAEAIESISRRLGLTTEVVCFADTCDEALRKAKSNLGERIEIIDLERTEPEERSIAVEAYDCRRAAAEAKESLRDQEVLQEVALAKAGRNGLWGIGKKPNSYTARIVRSARVRMIYRFEARAADKMVPDAAAQEEGRAATTSPVGADKQAKARMGRASVACAVGAASPAPKTRATASANATSDRNEDDLAFRLGLSERTGAREWVYDSFSTRSPDAAAAALFVEALDRLAVWDEHAIEEEHLSFVRSWGSRRLIAGSARELHKRVLQNLEWTAREPGFVKFLVQVHEYPGGTLAMIVTSAEGRGASVCLWRKRGGLCICGNKYFE
jgi:hypothetical protein